MNDKTALTTTTDAQTLPAGADPNLDAQAIVDRLGQPRKEHNPRLCSCDQ